MDITVVLTDKEVVEALRAYIYEEKDMALGSDIELEIFTKVEDEERKVKGDIFMLKEKSK
jgi:hypothetical protein